jgi:hypothetical protein
MTEPDPSETHPLTCVNHDHGGNICEWCIALTNNFRCFSASTNALTIVVSSLSANLLNLCWDYDALKEQNLHNYNLLQAAMTAHRVGLTDETYRVEWQLEQDLNVCRDLNSDLLHRLDNLNLEIASLCLKNEAYVCKEQNQDDQNKDDKVIEWGRKRPCFDNLSP